MTGRLEPSFVGSFPRADVSLDPVLPEIALLGRSNVGKSSLLNSLLGTRIAKVSGTPGKTRALNVFRISMAGTRPAVAPATGKPPLTAHRAFYFLDLPGYGYARVSKTERIAFRRLLAAVLERPQLAGAVWLLDLRHEPSADDRDMHELLGADHVRVLAAFTKADKLARGARMRRAGELQEALHLDDDQIVITSAETGDGIADLRDAIVGLVAA